MPHDDSMAELDVQVLLQTPTVSVADVCCAGTCKHQSPAECATATLLVFPYRGVYARHLGRDQAIAEANQVLFFNSSDGYRVCHPLAGGDLILFININEAELC